MRIPIAIFFACLTLACSKPAPKANIPPTTITAPKPGAKPVIEYQPPQAAAPAPRPSYSSSSSTTQVKGYYRKDGTYVKPHSRKK